MDKKQKEQINTKEEDKMNAFLREMREKSKRKVMREYEKGNYLWDNLGRRFTDKSGNTITDLKFKLESNEK